MAKVGHPSPELGGLGIGAGIEVVHDGFASCSIVSISDDSSQPQHMSTVLEFQENLEGYN